MKNLLIACFCILSSFTVNAAEPHDTEAAYGDIKWTEVRADVNELEQILVKVPRSPWWTSNIDTMSPLPSFHIYYNDMSKAYSLSTTPLPFRVYEDLQMHIEYLSEAFDNVKISETDTAVTIQYERKDINWTKYYEECEPSPDGTIPNRYLYTQEYFKEVYTIDHAYYLNASRIDQDVALDAASFLNSFKVSSL
jgi:hypothetical protein